MRDDEIGIGAQVRGLAMIGVSAGREAARVDRRIVITIWVELSATRLERAKAFYEAVFKHAPTEIITDGPRRITIPPGNGLTLHSTQP